MSASLNMPLSNDLIRYSWESEVTVRSQLIQDLQEALRIVYSVISERVPKMDSTVIVNIAVINIQIAVFSRPDNILK